MSSLLIKMSLALCLLGPSLSFACGVPYCNIPEEVSSLRSKTGDQRGMYAINLKAKYKDSSNASDLKNVYQLGLELKNLFTELKDEDWIQRAAGDLLNTVVFNLAKYSEVNGQELVNYYKQFATQTFRYSLISFWQGQLNSIEDTKTLEELIVFADGARTHSVTVSDEDWVSRAASSLISDITIKLTNLDPAHEGLYNVKLSDASLALGILPFDKIAVLDSSSSKNLVVVFINSKLRVPVYNYSHAEIIGNTVSGIFLSNGETSNKFSFNFNRSSGEVSGIIESTTNDRIEFSGQQVFSARTVFAGKAPVEVTKKDVIGTMKGVLAGVSGKLAIRSFMDNVYSATFTSDNGAIVLNFQGKFFPKNAVLSLTSNEKVKMMLSYRETGSGNAAWMGASFSVTTGTMTKAQFEVIK